jgi:hypothetical protein
MADMQAELAKSEVGVTIKVNQASARKAEADGEASYIEGTGKARGAEVRAVGLARAESYEAQVRALGATPTALVNAIDSLSKVTTRFVPDVLITGGGNGHGNGAVDGLAGVLTRMFLGGAQTAKDGKGKTTPAEEKA